jgi:hypothetical protein
MLYLEKWKDLKRHSGLEVVISEHATKMKLSTIQDLETFESLNKIILPNEYKEFCMIYGEGIFGINLFNIWCLPCSSNNGAEEEDMSARDIFYYDNDMIDNYKTGCYWDEGFETILESALFFGQGSQTETSFIFDLKSYSSTDLSCNIYGIKCSTWNHGCQSSTGKSYFLGRSFFKFIKEICIENKAELECPSLMPSSDAYLLSDDQPNYWNRKTFVVFGGEDESAEIPDEL